MQQRACVIGIDVSKDRLEVAMLDVTNERWLASRRSVSNTGKGFGQLIDWVRPYGRVHLVLEATGSYHQRLVEALWEAGLTVSVVNPLQIKRFAEMELRRGKTDRADAQLIARYGAQRHPAPYVPASGAERQLKQINTLHRQLVKQRTALENLRHAQEQMPGLAQVCREVLQQQLEQIEQSLRHLEKERQRLAEQAHRQTYRLIQSVTGIGAQTAAALVAYLGNLSRFGTPQQLSAFVGLNPKPHQSGKRQLPGHISKQGQPYLRTLLYMCAQSAARHNRACRALYERLLQRGKKKKVALIAVANKLLKQVFVVVKKGVVFDNTYYDKIAVAT